jgi:hypothetical protein
MASAQQQHGARQRRSDLRTCLLYDGADGGHMLGGLSYGGSPAVGKDDLMHLVSHSSSA